MKLAKGLYARFLAALVLALLVVLAVVVVVLNRQEVMRKEVLELGRESMHSLAFDRLAERSEAAGVELATGLVNPLYYFDLEEIGVLLRSMLKQPDVAYAVVYDNDGAVIHDGSRDIRSYGEVMDDAMAFEVVTARAPHVQANDEVLDVAVPLYIGDVRLGGLRVGYSLASVMADEQRAANSMGQRLAVIGQRHAGSIAALMAGLVLLAVGLGVLVQRALVRPVRQLADAAREIEAGNFVAEMPSSKRADEVGDLMRAFGRMRESIARHDRDMRRMAYTDALTGLANRLAFRESLDRRLMELHGAGRQLALLFADIDDFKRVNDTLGHDAGDEVLVQFANRIRETVDRLGGDSPALARFGGDEFVILIESPDSDSAGIREQASHLAETLVAELSRPIVVGGRQVFLGTSIGITLFPDDAVGATMLMKNGDIAMYQAKVAGKSCHRFYSRAMDQAVERRVSMEQDLRGAWERGELSLAYQPIYRLEDRSLVGAEALLRWHHPEHGMIAPSVFIDVAEQSGLIETIGPQVLHAACVDAMGWRRDFPDNDLFVSVNVSPRQLRSGDLAALVDQTLAQTGLPPEGLHIELTETAVIGDELRVSSLLARLRDAGVKVWLDDFGTGFSGLSHLRRVPVEGVKIDRSFVADVLRDPDDLALTTAIIAMAHSLGITVVAEGVEKEGQYEVLRERGCDLAQGYWLGYPMNVHDFRGLLG